MDAGSQIAQYGMQALALLEASNVIDHVNPGFCMIHIIADQNA
jgi:hypothetical protein